jgi:hypothetical protein
MPHPRKPDSPHRLSIKLGNWFEAQGSGYGVLAIIVGLAGYAAGRAWGVW